MSQHIMGDLPDDNLAGTVPFVYTAINMFGQWTTTGIAKGRWTFKTWGIMFSCLTTKAVSILACPSYNTEIIPLTYKFTAHTGRPCAATQTMGRR